MAYQTLFDSQLSPSPLGERKGIGRGNDDPNTWMQTGADQQIYNKTLAELSSNQP